MCGLLNARSIVNKSGTIREEVIHKEVDILGITETWIRDGDEPVIIDMCPPNYRFTGHQRPDDKGRRGGGVGFLLKSDLEVKEKQHSYRTFEALTIEWRRDVKSCISILYRPPPSQRNGFTVSDFMLEIEDFLSTMCLEYKMICVMGDFNVHFGDHGDPQFDQFKSILDCLNLKQIIDTPTHNKGNILDLVIVNEENRAQLKEVDANGISDHAFITYHLMKECITAKEKRSVRVRPLKNLNINALIGDISPKLRRLTDGSNADELISMTNAILRDALDRHAPKKMIKLKGEKHKGWYNDEIHEERRKRRRLERKFKKTKLEVDNQILKDQRRKVVRMVDSAKKEYYQRKLDNASCNDTFKVIDSLLDNERTHPLPSARSDAELSEKFSHYFREKIEKICTKLNETDAGVDVDDEIPNRHVPLLEEFQPVTCEDIKMIINSSPCKTCDLDPTPTSLLKNPQMLDALLPTITKLVNQSLSSGIVPRDLKLAQVVPRLKKKNLDVEVMANYRPVSNIPFIGKILEKVVVSQLNDHLKRNNLHDPYQSAYRQKHSVETAILKVKTDIERVIDEGDASILVMLDLSAAFDTINHQILLDRIEQEIGIRGTPLNWLRSYLSERKQQCKINEAVSQETDLSVGVPQGSVLGPILFTLYLLPMGRIIDRHKIFRHGYADDTQLYCRMPLRNDEERAAALDRMNSCIRDVRGWMLKNKLMINDNKTELLLFCSKRAQHQLNEMDITVNVGSIVIHPSTAARNLGVVLDSQLTMEHHAKAIIKSAHFHLRRIKNIRHHLTESACKKAIHACVTSRLDCQNALLVGCSASTKRRLQIMQNNAARVVSRTRHRQHMTPVLRDLHWLPVHARILFKSLTILHAAIHVPDAPFYLKIFVKFYRGPPQHRSAGDNFKLLPSTYNSLTGANAFTCRTFNHWNDLPFTLREIDSHALFKNRLKTFLFGQSYS